MSILFVKGQMKLFGTIVYPKNKYLGLQFSRGGKSAVCEDCFDNMVCSFPWISLFFLFSSSIWQFELFACIPFSVFLDCVF